MMMSEIDGNQDADADDHIRCLERKKRKVELSVGGLGLMGPRLRCGIPEPACAVASGKDSRASTPVVSTLKLLLIQHTACSVWHVSMQRLPPCNCLELR